MCDTVCRGCNSAACATSAVRRQQKCVLLVYALFVGCTAQVIKLGDKEVEWDPNFRLYLTSKLSNPHYGPEVCSKTSIINYGLTQQGLAEQLLGVTVSHERPDLEEARSVSATHYTEGSTG